MSELSKTDVDKLLQAIRKVPPRVVGTPIDRNDYVVEFAEEAYFKNFKKDDYKMTALELFELLEDIEKVESITANDPKAFSSLVKELTSKRFIYLSNEKAIELKKIRNSQQ